MTTALTAAVLQLLGVVQLPVPSEPLNATTKDGVTIPSPASASTIPPPSLSPPPACSSPSPNPPSPPSPSLDLVHRVAQLAHCLAQGKAGSGFDVAAAVFGSCSYRRFSPAIIQPFMVRGGDCQALIVRHHKERFRPRW